MNNKTEDFLAHYGKLGMKWGRRNNRSAENVAVSVLRKKGAHHLSDSELKQAIGRMQLERQYRELNPKGISKGQKIVVGVLALGTTINSVLAFRNSALGRSIESEVKRTIKRVTR